jgi:hypothetical protein
MRLDCKHYESRTYASGEVVRMCRLDLAPEAPWKCPVDCPKYERRVIDAGWTRGTLVERETPPPPPPGVEAAALLDEAEDIINAVGPETLAEVMEQRAKAAAKPSLWQRLRPRRR